LETIDRDLNILFKRFGFEPQNTSSMQFNSHALHTDYDVVKRYFDSVPNDLIFKLYSFYKDDYIAFGYNPPWSWLNIQPPNSEPKFL